MTPILLPIDVYIAPTSVLDRRVAAHSKCAGSNDDAFHDPTYEDDAERAYELCAGCPVIAECLEAALRTEAGYGVRAYGVYGGETPAARRRMHRTRVAQAASA